MEKQLTISHFQFPGGAIMFQPLNFDCEAVVAASTSGCERELPKADLCKRGVPLSSDIVFELVKYLDETNYDEKQGKMSYKQKSAILEELCRIIFSKFGKHITKRQIQKRYSDLKVRNPLELERIRKEILQCAAGNEIEQSDVTSKQEVALEIIEQPTCTLYGEQLEINRESLENATCTEDTFMLHLQPVENQIISHIVYSATPTAEPSEIIEIPNSVLYAQIKELDVKVDLLLSKVDALMASKML